MLIYVASENEKFNGLLGNGHCAAARDRPIQREADRQSPKPLLRRSIRSESQGQRGHHVKSNRPHTTVVWYRRIAVLKVGEHHHPMRIVLDAEDVLSTWRHTSCVETISAGSAIHQRLHSRVQSTHQPRHKVVLDYSRPPELVHADSED